MPYEGNTAFAAEVASPFKTVVSPLDSGLGIGKFQPVGGGGTVTVGVTSLAGKAHASFNVAVDSTSTQPIAGGTYILVLATINGVSMEIDRIVWPTSQVAVREEYHSLVGELLTVQVVTPVTQAVGCVCTGAVHASSI